MHVRSGLRSWLNGFDKTRQPWHTSTLDTVNDLSTLYAMLGQYEEAEVVFQLVLQGKEKGSRQLTTCNLYKNMERLNAAEYIC
jgi:hypothetical protein